MLYKINRLSLTHKVLRKCAYAVLKWIPEGIKFSIIHFYLKNIAPYKFVSMGDTVIQIGAPSDILKTGRSRWTHLAKIVGMNGKVVIIEPDKDNIVAIKRYIERKSLNNIIVIDQGCWSEKTQKNFLVDRDNPAANLVGEVYDESRSDRSRFTEVSINVDKLDNMVAALNIEFFQLLSVTANGSENEILIGAQETLKTCKILAIVGSVEKIPALKLFDHKEMLQDDRGTTFIRS